MRTNNFKTPTSKLPSVGRAATNTFHADLAHFFNSDDAVGHVNTVTKLCAAFTRSSISEYATASQIADMVYATDEIREFINNVEMAYLYGDKDLMTPQQSSAIGDLLAPVGSRTLIYLLKMGLQDWIIDTNQSDYYDDFKDESIPHFWLIQDLINLCYAIHHHVTNNEAEEGGASC